MYTIKEVHFEVLIFAGLSIDRSLYIVEHGVASDLEGGSLLDIALIVRKLI